MVQERKRIVMNERMRRKKDYDKEFAMRKVVCLTCGCRVRKCKWGSHID